MPSNLRLQLDTQSTQSYYPQKTIPSPPAQKSRMSLTQTYRVASTARGKLGMEAARPDHNLRLLVGHANLLDSLMLELANAEREQEAWFHATVNRASSTKPESSPRHVQWFDNIAEEADYDDDSSDSDSESDDEDLPELEMIPTTRRRSVSPPPPSHEFDDEDVEDYDEDLEELALERVQSRTPDLVHEHEDSEDSSDDEAHMPPSPPLPVIHFTSSKTKSTTATIDFADLSNKDPLAIGSGAAHMIPAF